MVNLRCAKEEVKRMMIISQIVSIFCRYPIKWMLFTCSSPAMASNGSLSSPVPTKDTLKGLCFHFSFDRIRINISWPLSNRNKRANTSKPETRISRWIWNYLLAVLTGLAITLLFGNCIPNCSSVNRRLWWETKKHFFRLQISFDHERPVMRFRPVKINCFLTYYHIRDIQVATLVRIY